MPTSQEKNPVLEQTLAIAIGEGVVCLLIVLGYWILDLIGLYDFTYKALTGALLGALVIVLNFYFLARSVDRATLRAMAARPEHEMSEEEIEKWTAEQRIGLENAIKLSFIVRMVSMLVALALALLLPVFEVVATLIPLLMLRPILMVAELIRKKEETV